MTPPLRFTFVLSRYGEEILGGGEKHARAVAEQLAAHGHEVRVLTTCAEHYSTWSNSLAEGTAWHGGVEVVRFPVAIGRLRPLDQVTKLLASTLRDVRSLGWAWSLAQGPTVPALARRLDEEAPRRDLLVFFSLLSQLTFAGLRRVGNRSALVPLVHEEPPIYARLSRETLCLPRALLVNTEEEWTRIRRVAGPGVATGAIVAVGLEEPLPAQPTFEPPTRAPYLLILGRAGKTGPMRALWRELSGRADLPPMRLKNGSTSWRDVKLVTVGEISRLFAGLPNVIQLPFVDESTRWQLIRNATALINPSRYESLSLVLLEAWSCGVPVIVNQSCDVTTGQCRRSGGGVAIDFDSPARAANQLALALADRSIRDDMGRRGETYARERYRWDRVIGAYEAAARALREGVEMSKALAAWSPPS
jgi:hypothetical protein